MVEIRLTPAAKDHLLDIWAYTEMTWGESQADEYVMGIDKIFQKIADNPQIGKARPEIQAGYRSVLVKNHVVFNTVSDSGDCVTIIGVLHARMDVDRRL